MLKHKLDITSDFRKSHKIHNRHDFRYYYADSNDLVKDFENYLVVQISHKPKQASQYQADVRQIWTAVDANRSIFPRNYLRDPDLIEDYFYRPLYVSLQENLKLPKEEQSPHIQASTIKSKLCSLSVFCRFLMNRGLYISLTIEDLQCLTLRVQELCSSLNKNEKYQFNTSEVIRKQKNI